MTTERPEQSLLRLLTWLSPAFPVGGFAYSGGLETAVREGHVTNASELRDWLETGLHHGTYWNDAVLLAEAWKARGDAGRLRDVADLARALAGSAERHLELTAQGEAFMEAAAPWSPAQPDGLDRTVPYPVAVGAVAADNGVALHETLVAWLHALVSQSVSAAIRLGVLGQREAMAVISVLEASVLKTADRARTSSPDDLGSATILADIMSARHETLGSRLFRS
jgi:urease accessory protein